MHYEFPEVTENLHRAIGWTHRHLGRFFEQTYEQWELRFLKDDNPAREIAVWMRVTWMYLEFCERYPSRQKSLIRNAVLSSSLNMEPEGLEVEEVAELRELMKAHYPHLHDLSHPIYDT